MGQLGYDNATNFDRNKEGAYFLPAPTPVEFLADKQICQVVAGWGHSAVLSRDGRVFPHFFLRMRFLLSPNVLVLMI